MNLEVNCNYRSWMKESFINQDKTTVNEEGSGGGQLMTKIRTSRDDVIG